MWYETNFCVILDGLDYVSIDDVVFNNPQHQILDYIMSRRGSLTNFRFTPTRSRFVRSVPMMVMRSNTFDLFHKEKQIAVENVHIFQVAPLNPEVVTGSGATGSPAWAARSCARSAAT